MLVSNNSYELATTYLQVFLHWMFCSELVLSYSCFYFVVTCHFIPVWGPSILRANLSSTEKSAAGKVGLTLPRWKRRSSIHSGAGLWRFDDVPGVAKTDILLWGWKVNCNKIIVLQHVTLQYLKKCLFWMKIDNFWLFHNSSGIKNRFQQLWKYKIFKHCQLPCIPCLGKMHIKLQWYNIFPFVAFAT